MDENSLIVDLYKAIEVASKKQDLLRSQNGWVFENNPDSPPIESKEALYEEDGINEMEE